MALKSNALTDLATAKEHLEIPVLNTDFDTRIERFINTTSAFFEQNTSRKFITQTFTEYQDGRGTNRIVLKHWPITGGPADGATKPELSIDYSSDFGASTVINPDSYEVDSESTFEIVLTKGSYLGRYFPRGTRNIKIVYEAGYGTVIGGDLPDDLVNAALDHVLWLYDRQTDRRIGRTNKSKGDENVTYEVSVPKSIMDVLDSYRRMEFSPPVGIKNA